MFSGLGVGAHNDPTSATVTFETTQHNFGSGMVSAVQISLTNTAASTNWRDNLITGVFFTLPTSVGPLPTNTTGFDGLAVMVATARGVIVSNANVDVAPAVNITSTDGGYQLSNGPFGSAGGASYSAFTNGIATVSMGLTGFNHHAVNGEDYGIFAAGSYLSSGQFNQDYPLIDSSVKFWIAAPATWTSMDQLGSSVRITYGSGPDEYFTATSQRITPEPSTWALVGAGLAAAAYLRSRKRRGARS